MKFIQDGFDHNTFFALAGTTPVGMVHRFAPGEWKAINRSGQFVGWFQSKKEAAAAL